MYLQRIKDNTGIKLMTCCFANNLMKFLANAMYICMYNRRYCFVNILYWQFCTLDLCRLCYMDHGYLRTIKINITAIHY